MRHLYSFLLVLLAPFLLAWMALRARHAGGTWEICSAERFGRYRDARPPAGAIWIHAVSLGETRAAHPLICALLQRGHRVLLTHLTATGRAQGRQAYASEIAAGRLQQVWLPYDFSGATRRFMHHYRPAVGVLIERELWPNLVQAANRTQVPLVLASARMSKSSLRRNLRLGRLMREAYASLTRTYAQSLADARRLEHLGAGGVSVSGNFKFDLTPDGQHVTRGQQFAARLARPVVVIASTREGEDPPFIRAIQSQTRRWEAQGIGPEQRPLFFLVPRHPERFDEAARLLEAAHLNYVRRTRLQALGDGCGSAIDACREAAVMLGDTLGEMPWYYACAQVVIVGGGFAPLGGQNFIEASALGCPVLVGPHMENFEQAVHDALQADALARARTPEAAVQQALHWLGDAALRARMREAARYWVSQHSGAVTRVLDGIEELLAGRAR